MMINFTFELPSKIQFGVGVRHHIKTLLEQKGWHNVVLISDSFLLTTPFAKALVEEIKPIATYQDVIANPTIASANDCANFLRDIDCDVIIALGGGSCIDTAKAASISALSGIPVECYMDTAIDKEEVKTCLPLIAIPTTAGTGSEVSQYAVLTDEKTFQKNSISSVKICPDYAFVDPEVTYDLPKMLTISTGLDVLSHALEAIFSPIESAPCEVFALEALRISYTWLKECGKAKNEEARQQMAYASLLAGIAMSDCCGVLPHGMGCPLSSYAKVPHGLACGLLQPYAIETMKEIKKAECYKILKTLQPNTILRQEDAGTLLIDLLKALFHDLGIEDDLRDYPCSEEAIHAMCKDALAHGCTKLHPVVLNYEEIYRIYEGVLGKHHG